MPYFRCTAFFYLSDAFTNEGEAMSNKAIAITVLILLIATGYLLVVSDEPIDMGGEKHGAEATQAHDQSKEAKETKESKPAEQK